MPLLLHAAVKVVFWVLYRVDVPDAIGAAATAITQHIQVPIDLVQKDDDCPPTRVPSLLT